MKRRLDKLEARMPWQDDAERLRVIRQMTDEELRDILRANLPVHRPEGSRPDSAIGYALDALEPEAITALTGGRR